LLSHMNSRNVKSEVMELWTDQHLVLSSSLMKRLHLQGEFLPTNENDSLVNNMRKYQLLVEYTSYTFP